ncbi:MAG: hypothetical protein JNM70_19430 [Anaerolineae bacterium]|nr:hypothetical protein [Anaerolineae bacterium]
MAPESRLRMLSALQQEVTSGQVSLAAWLDAARAARITLRPDAEGHVPTASELLNEAREERDADLLQRAGLRNSAGDGSN